MPINETRQQSTFDGAVSRMHGQGYRPFCPDRNTAHSARWLRDHEMPDAVRDSAARIDALIAAFAVGVLLGMVVGARMVAGA